MAGRTEMEKDETMQTHWVVQSVPSDLLLICLIDVLIDYLLGFIKKYKNLGSIPVVWFGSFFFWP